jgi:hypothetical protein
LSIIIKGKEAITIIKIILYIILPHEELRFKLFSGPTIFFFNQKVKGRFLADTSVLSP